MQTGLHVFSHFVLICWLLPYEMFRHLVAYLSNMGLCMSCCHVCSLASARLSRLELNLCMFVADIYFGNQNRLITTTTMIPRSDLLLPVLHTVLLLVICALIFCIFCLLIIMCCKKSSADVRCHSPSLPSSTAKCRGQYVTQCEYLVNLLLL